MTFRLPPYLRTLVDVITAALALVVLAAVVGVGLAAMALAQPVPFVSERIGEPVDEQRDIDITNTIRTEESR